jgi:hypothetical protein
MSNPKTRTPEERSIIYGMALRGASLPAINEALRASSARPLPASSYRSIVRDYAPYFRADPSRLLRATVSPPTWSDLKAA